MFTFEDKLDIVNKEIRKRRSKWQLHALKWIDYEDVEQILRRHFWLKWHLWDQSRPLEHWLSRVISNQMRNLIRNHYSNYARPCLQCKHNLGETSCAITPSNEQCTECPIYKKWTEKKKAGYDIKLPLELENHLQEVNNKPSEEIDYEGSLRLLDVELKRQLSPELYTAYQLVCLEKKTDDELIAHFNFKNVPKNSAAKQLKSFKKGLYLTVKKILKESDIGELWF